ncbi:hypothetical protein, partial [Pseudonocardia acaciae]|uniref:hypothetical protein n=1 Tax=Pseudonocardia acaciae TaxID=551276 RepID=UPI0005692D77
PPRAVPTPPRQQQPQTPGKHQPKPNNPAQQTNQQKKKVEPLISPIIKSVESGVQNALGKFHRYERTLRDAATRHLVASDQWAKKADRMRGSKVPGANWRAGLADKYGKYRAGRATWYGNQSKKLGEITKKTLRQGGIHGHIPVDKNDPTRTGWKKLIPTQRLMSATLADKFNRLPNGKTNPKITNSPAVKNAVNNGQKVTNNIKRIGGLRGAETLRRGLTKVSGPVAIAAGIAETSWQIAHGAKPGEAIGKTGSSIAVSAAAGSATTALLGTAAASAFVPGPGWAVAGGIVVGIGASYAWDKLGGSKLAAKAGGWVQDQGTKAFNGAKKAVSSGVNKVKKKLKFW